MAPLSDEELIELFSRQLPDLLERRPDLEPVIYNVFLKILVRKEEVAAVLAELREFRAEANQHFEQIDHRLEQIDHRLEQVDHRLEQVDHRFEQVDHRLEQVDQRFEQVDQRFEQIDQRFEQVDQRFNTLEARMETGFRDLHQAIDRLGARWGIRNESLFRQTIAALLEQSFGVTVEQRMIAGEQFDVLIFDHQHMLVEIAASVGPTIQERLERKRRLYTEATGITPTRMILATASIHSHRAQALRQQGIEVIEPEEIE
jgi:hypothetical protein